MEDPIMPTATRGTQRGIQTDARRRGAAFDTPTGLDIPDQIARDTIARTRVRRTPLDRLDAFLRSNAVRLVLLFLVANTILA
jgi:hypothetical protein